MYKYYAHKKSEYIDGNVLAHVDGIKRLFDLSLSTEHHASIMDYDKSGLVLGCPIYMDIDCPNIHEAFDITKRIVSMAIDKWCVKPFVFFSGSKGFHLLIPHYIKSDRCNEMVKALVELRFSEFTKAIDWGLYRSRGLLRMNGSVNHKSGLFKTQVCIEDDMEKILNSSSARCPAQPIRYIVCDRIVNDQRSIVLPTPVIHREHKVIEFDDMLPCVRRLWREGADVGNRHHSVFILSVHMKRSGMDEDEIMEAFESHSFYSDIISEHRKVVRGVFNRDYGMSCNSPMGMFLKSYCSGLCPFDISYEDTIRI